MAPGNARRPGGPTVELLTPSLTAWIPQDLEALERRLIGDENKSLKRVMRSGRGR